MTNPTRVEYPAGVVELRDGIVWLTYPPGTVFLPEHVRPQWDAMRAVWGPGPMLVISDTEGLESVSAETRKLLESPETLEVFGALGILGMNPLGRMLGNFWLKASRPAFPTRIFGDAESAVAWLRT